MDSPALLSRKTRFAEVADQLDGVPRPDGDAERAVALEDRRGVGGCGGVEDARAEVDRDGARTQVGGRTRREREHADYNQP